MRLTPARIIGFVLAIVGLFVLYLVGIEVRERYGIKVVVRNESSETLRGVRVKVETLGPRGQTRDLGDLEAGQRKQVFVEPVTESHINVEFADSKSAVRVETIFGYAEAGYCGTGDLTVLSGGKTETRQTVDLDCRESWFGFL